jgi:hypothetical protein
MEDVGRPTIVSMLTASPLACCCDATAAPAFCPHSADFTGDCHPLASAI